MAEVEAALSRIETQVSSADFVLLKRLAATVEFGVNVVRTQRAAIARMRRFLGVSSSEKVAMVHGQDDPPGPVPLQGLSPPGPTVDPGSNAEPEVPEASRPPHPSAPAL